MCHICDVLPKNVMTLHPDEAWIVSKKGDYLFGTPGDIKTNQFIENFYLSGHGDGYPGHHVLKDLRKNFGKGAYRLAEKVYFQELSRLDEWHVRIWEMIVRVMERKLIAKCKKEGRTIFFFVNPETFKEMPFYDCAQTGIERMSFTYWELIDLVHSNPDVFAIVFVSPCKENLNAQS